MNNLLLSLIVIITNAANLHRLNSIEAIVPGTKHLVTSMDMMQRSFDGSDMELDEIVREHLLELYGKEVFSMNIDNEMIDRYLEKMGLGKNQLEYLSELWLFKDLSEFYELFKRVHGSGGTMQQIIESLMTVTEDILQQIYEKNPKWREPALLIQTAVVPFSNEQAKTKIKKLIDEANFGKIKGLKWDEEAWSFESELSPEVKFLVNLEEGDYSTKEYKNEFVIFKLVKKRPKELIPLADRRPELIMEARKVKYDNARKIALDKVNNRYVVFKPTHSDLWQSSELDVSVAKPAK